MSAETPVSKSAHVVPEQEPQRASLGQELPLFLPVLRVRELPLFLPVRVRELPLFVPGQALRRVVPVQVPRVWRPEQVQLFSLGRELPHVVPGRAPLFVPVQVPLFVPGRALQRVERELERLCAGQVSWREQEAL